MTDVYYSVINCLPPETVVEKKIRQLPLPMQQQVMAYGHMKDRVARLTGKLLLREFINRSGLAGSVSLDKLVIDDNGKPLLGKQLFFSVAHTEEMTVMAAGRDGMIGIDIEKIQQVDILMYQDYFTPAEWQWILAAPNNIVAFYKLWTRKEAVLKAMGKGLITMMNTVEVLNDIFNAGSRCCYIKQIRLLPQYSCHLATLQPPEQIRITALNPFDEA